MFRKARSPWPAATARAKPARRLSRKTSWLPRYRKLLLDIHTSMLERATAYRDSNIHDPSDYEELKSGGTNAWAFSWWCGSPACEAKVKEDTRATTRCIPLEQPGGSGPCIVCGGHSTEKVYFARAY
jgi:prolyl-tRNA synthetase